MADFARVRQVRAKDPSSIARYLESRSRRQLLLGDDRLLIIAADHPARGALAVGSDPMAMASRYDLLRRIVLALSRPGVDGVLGTPDILEDLAILGVLDGKLAVGSMNRGGLRGAVFEMDDRYTAYDVDSMVRSKLDMAKLLVRISLDDPATPGALESAANAVTRSAEMALPLMIEPFMSHRVNERIVNDFSAEAVITSIAIASALGASSAYSWLKLPVVPDMERALEATTLPTLLLGGDLNGDAVGTYKLWGRALALDGVHGLTVGRTLLYPEDGDVAGAVDAAAALVHG
ncbi:Cgl0159 family (beta/alpha)8-fold protein [Rhodoglobus aureus]|uniref:Cgl0159 family (beta/alpha)8-fold protein n=1 Tax=Rhodoglobus aureus TaxID=191497 RepID=UPI003CD05CE2